MFRNLVCSDSGNISGDWSVIQMIGLVGQLCILIPLTGENASATSLIEGGPKPAYAREQIDET